MGKRMLCVTAHPDDEAGGFGGSLLLYAERQVETYVVCLTPGQAASHRGGYKSDESLAAARRQEFANSCKLLKVSRAEVLDYPDGRLAQVPLETVVYDLVERIRRIRPHIVVTFGAEGGGTAHPDHSMASIFATMAYHWAGRSNRFTEQLNDGVQPHITQKLYWTTSSFRFPNRQPIAPSPRSATIDIEPYVSTKIEAFKQHTTQSPLFPLVEENLRRRGAVETFHLAAYVHIGAATAETDLFAGVED